MFNIGPAELIVILLIALLVVGPARLPEMGKTIGKGLREFRKATDEVRYSFEADLDDDASVSENGHVPESAETPSSKQPRKSTPPPSEPS